jgi:hypothetical protein
LRFKSNYRRAFVPGWVTEIIRVSFQGCSPVHLIQFECTSPQSPSVPPASSSDANDLGTPPAPGAVLFAHVLSRRFHLSSPLLPYRDKATALSLTRKLNQQVSLQRTVVSLSSSHWSLKLEVIHER